MSTAAATAIKPEPNWSSGKPEDLKAAIDKLNQALAVVRTIDSELVHAYYGLPTVTGVDAQALAAVQNAGAAQTILANRRKFNLVKSAIDSFCAMVVELPAIDVTTVWGDWDGQRSAEALGQFVDGVYAASKMRSILWQCVVDCCLQRVAAVKVEVDGDNAIVVRRILPHTIFWNPKSGGTPRELFTVTATPRSQLLAKYPEKAREIKEAPAAMKDGEFDDLDGVGIDVTDEVDLLEGYRTMEPSVEKSGRYVAMVGNTVLEDDEDWKMRRHVIVPLRYEWSYSSFAGVPAAETLWGYQSELDDFASTIKETFVKCAAPWNLIPNDSGIAPETLDNIPGRNIHHNPGKPPVRELGVTLPPEYLEREEKIIRRAFDFMGMSYDAARGVKADGVPSAKGQREVAALGQSRQLLRKQGVQDFVEEVAKTIVAVADARADKKKDFEATAPGGKILSRVKWSEIGYKEADFVFKCDAINALSRHPAARIEEILELVQGKVISGKQGLKLVANKDLQSLRDEAFAREDFAQKIIGLALKGDLRQPDPYCGLEGLQLIVDRGEQRYIVELVQEKQSKNLGQLRRLIEAARTELKKLQASAPAPVPVPPAPLEPGADGAEPGAEDLSVGGAGLPAQLPPAAAPMPVPGQGLA